MAELSIREILDQITRGQIRIPAFQRGFVWEPERVGYLMDSIHKRYPFGSLLFWRTREKLKSDRKLGPFTLPEPQADYPIDYVLDGQQRITSIFGVFQSSLKPDADDETYWLPVYFDLQGGNAAQESQFASLTDDLVDPKRHFPLATLFDTVAYRKATEGRSNADVEKIDKMQEIFKEVKIPVQMSSTEEKATVAIIFERINRQGVELNTLQLLSAWTWSEEFQLQEQFADLAEELDDFGFAEVGEDTNLLLRCCSAILQSDASPEALMSMNGGEVRDAFDTVTNGIKYAVDYLRNNFHVAKLSNLPFSTILVPLSVFFAVPANKEASVNNDQRAAINQWFWRVCFSKRYSSAVLRGLKTDIEQMRLLQEKKPHELGNFYVDISPDFFKVNTFGLQNVNTKTFVLLLASMGPRSFVSGEPVDLAATLKEANRTEFHHLMPKAFLKSSKQFEWGDSVLANFGFLSRADNRMIGGDPPSVYRAKMPADSAPIVQSAVCADTLFKDKYAQFIDERSEALAQIAAGLCGVQASKAVMKRRK